jgi:hypothetical protein
MIALIPRSWSSVGSILTTPLSPERECLIAILLLSVALVRSNGGQSKEQERKEFLHNELDDWQIAHFLPPKHLLFASTTV